MRREQGRFPGIAISAIEHPCVREPARQLAKAGGHLREIAVDVAGRIDQDDFRQALAQRPAIVSVMLANNETGVVQEIDALTRAAHGSGAWFHSDAVQALGKLPVDFRALNAAGLHALTLSAHKLGGPKGAGALVLDKRVELMPQIAGGGQERGLRSGTENVAAIAGFGEACRLISERLDKMAGLHLLRATLETGLRAQGAVIFGDTAERLPNTLYFALPEIEGDTLVGKLDRAGFAVASGAACSSAQPEPSHVLKAMGVPDALSRGAVRVSLGPDNTAQQVRDFLAALSETLFQLRRLTALAG